MTATARQLAPMSRDTLRVETTAASHAPAGSGGGLRVVAPALVGRTAELDVLLSAAATPPAVVTVEGEAGIGKTRLVAEFAAHPDMTGRQFLVGGCRRIREPFPLGPVIEAVRALGDDLAGASLSPVAGALRPLLPELGEWLPPQPPPLDDRASDRHRVFRGLAEILTWLGPAVLVLDDLHWADEQTGEFLAYLLGDPPPQLAVVLTFRGEEVDPALRAVTARLPASLRRAEVILRPLDAEQTGTLAAAILETDHISEEFAAHLQQRTAGLPFAIEEVVALLRARHDLVRQEGGWARRALDELHVPTGIRDSVRERVSRLSEDARAVVEAAAVLQRPVPLSVLTATSRTATTTVLRSVGEALASGLLTEADTAVGFRHVLAAQAVYDDLAQPRRHELHSDAARALEMVHPPPLSQIAYHLRQTGTSAAWADAAERAADEAVELGDDAEAMRLYEDVLRHAPRTAAQAGAIAVKLARSASESARSSPATIDVLSGVLQRELSPVVRGELCLRLSRLFGHSHSNHDLRRRLLLEAVGCLNERPDLKAWAMMALGIPMASPKTALHEHARWLRRSLATLPDAADAGFKVFVHGKVAMALVAIGDPDWRVLTESIYDQTEGCPRTRRTIEAYASVGMAASYTGHYEMARRLLSAALEGAATCSSTRLALHVPSAMALLDYCQGEWDGLAVSATKLLDKLADVPAARIDVEIAAGCVALAHGDIAMARVMLSDVVEDGSQETLPFAVDAIIRLCIAEERSDEAVALVDRLMSGLALQGWAPIVRALPACVQALTLADRQPDARALVEQCAEGVIDLDVPLAKAALRHARGFLEAAHEQPLCAAEHFVAAAEFYDALPCPYQAAQAREEAALCLFEAGAADAEKVLAAAMATYERLGASWDAARCTRAARARGVRVAAPYRGGRRGYGDALSPRERDVAELAAKGHTNREIGAQLFITPSTVDKHLGGAMRKLDVRSRRELGGRLAANSRGGAASE